MAFRNAESEAGRITFTRASAARIANAVQVVENQRPAAQPLTFEPILEKPHIFRVGTVASAWAKGSQATVTLSRSGRTVAAQNLLVSLPSARTVNIAKDGTAWYLVSYEVGTATATLISSVSTQTLTYVAQQSTSTLTYQSAGTTSQITFVTGVAASLNTASCAIAITLTTATSKVLTAATTQTASIVSLASTQTAEIKTFSTYTATYLRLEL